MSTSWEDIIEFKKDYISNMERMLRGTLSLKESEKIRTEILMQKTLVNMISKMIGHSKGNIYQVERNPVIEKMCSLEIENKELRDAFRHLCKAYSISENDFKRTMSSDINIPSPSRELSR